jgi:hypothetical protein
MLNENVFAERFFLGRNFVAESSVEEGVQKLFLTYYSNFKSKVIFDTITFSTNHS